jgi:hypothetical protein
VAADNCTGGANTGEACHLTATGSGTGDADQAAATGPAYPPAVPVSRASTDSYATAALPRCWPDCSACLAMHRNP